MKMVPLGELIRSAPVERAGAETYPILSMTMHHGLVDQTAKFKKAVASQNLSQYKVVRRGQLVVSFPIDEGVLGFQEIYAAAIVSPAYAVWDLVDDSRVDRSYLGKYLKSPKAIQYYRAKLRGSTARRRSLPKSVFLAHEVPLPPLDEQRRIAAILDKADAIRQKRRQAIAHLDTLTQSIFRKMTRADKFDQSETGRFGELFKLKSGSFLPKSEQEPGEFPVYGGNGITGMHIEYLFGEPKIAIGRVGANCGAVHLTRPQSWITDNALYVDSTYRHFADEYLVFLLRSLDLNQYANRSGQPSISANRLNDIEIKIPELKVQTEFAHLANFIEAQSESHKVSLEYFESLFESLQSRAFRGEL